MPVKYCLILVVWGDRYSNGYINTLVNTVRKTSPGCDEFILFTDDHRTGLDEELKQILIPPDLRGPDFFRPGYPVKLCFLDQRYLPKSKICIYLDLDTLVLDSLDPLAEMCKTQKSIFMLPPSVQNFGVVARLMFRISRGKYYTAGNSSITVFRSDYGTNIPERFINDLQKFTPDMPEYMNSDDAYISYCFQNDLRNIPRKYCRMFRHVFLSRFLLLSQVFGSLSKYENLIAVTLNDAAFKPEQIVSWSENQVLTEPKGRRGIWSSRMIGPLKAKIMRLCEEILAE